jgi:hypothetical protein
MPLTKPDEEPMVATPVLLLLHVPPVNASLKGVVRPAQTFALPSIAVGVAFTVTISVW